MSFLRRQKLNLAARYLRWQFEKNHLPVPDEAELQRQSGIIVDEAQRIAARTGKNVLEIVKELIRGLRKPS